jgi:glycosyltransferase involved in cell wall biosynthesis
LGTDETIGELAQFYDGEGYIAHLRQRIGPSLASRVTFTDFIPNQELVPHFQHSDIFVFPSILAEAFGRPIVEAMAVEVPVIATRIGGMVELVDHGKTGLLIKPNDVNALTDALLFLLKNEPIRKEMGKRGRKRAQEMFSWEQVVESLQQRYWQLLSA